MIFRYGEKRKGSESAKELSGIALLSATLNQCKKPNQQLLILITVWIGMEQAFIGADFTQVSGTKFRSKRKRDEYFQIFVAGLCFVRTGYPSNWLRDDMFRCSQCNLFDSFWFYHEIYRQNPDYCSR